MPVVLNLHGFTWTTDDHANNTLMHEFADTSGFIVVYPEGSYSSGQPGWNNGLRNHSFGHTDTTANDVGFISALIDTLDAHYDIDLSRVYSCGFSMGGPMGRLHL
jgi:polyhydroxybutyrate depolymerase